MATTEDSAGGSARKPDPVHLSICLPRQNYDATLAVRPYVGGPPLVAVDVAMGAAHVASVALSEDAALDMALRLVAAVMRRREAGA
jgi:hypothetical protein